MEQWRLLHVRFKWINDTWHEELRLKIFDSGCSQLYQAKTHLSLNVHRAWYYSRHCYTGGLIVFNQRSRSWIRWCTVRPRARYDTRTWIINTNVFLSPSPSNTPDVSFKYHTWTVNINLSESSTKYTLQLGRESKIEERPGNSL